MKRERAKWSNFEERMRYGIRRCGLNYKRALERDRYSCAICGSSDNVVVHHLDGDIENNSIDNLLTVCKKCHAELHGQTLKFNSPTLEMISELRNQNKTYQEIGEYLGISRQRVHQLIKNYSLVIKKELNSVPKFQVGRPVRGIKCKECGRVIFRKFRMNTSEDNFLCEKCRERKRRNWKRYIICKACGRKVDRLKENSRSFRYCPKCHKIWAIEKRDPNITFKCPQCGKSFHPLRNWNNTGKPIYCSQKCYWASIRGETKAKSDQF